MAAAPATLAAEPKAAPRQEQNLRAQQPPSIHDAVASGTSAPSGPAPVSDREVATGLAAALAQMVAMTADTKAPLTRFHAEREPNISIRDYTARIARFFGCSGSCYVLGLVYIDRLIQRNPHIAVTSLSVHRLVFISLMVASKFHDDIFYSNSYYAKIGGLQLKEVNSLEARFLKFLDWKLQVNAVEFVKYRNLCLAMARGPRAAPSGAVVPA